MATAYVEELTRLIQGLNGHLSTDILITCKHFFSGAAAYQGDNIFMTLTPVGLALKLPEATRQNLLADGAQPLRYFPKAPIKKHYVLLSEQQKLDDAKLASLMKSSMAYVRNT